MNTFGNQPIDLCDMYECMIFNGLTECGFDDSCTYIPKTVSSAIDYFIMSRDLFYSVCVDSLDVGSLTVRSHACYIKNEKFWGCKCQHEGVKK